MKPGKLDLTIYQGVTFKKPLTLKNEKTGQAIDLTGTTLQMQLRETVDSEIVIIELNEANGRALVIDPPAGKIKLEIDYTDTELLTFKKAVYDLEMLYSDNTKDRLLQGKVTLSPEVTRPVPVTPP